MTLKLNYELIYKLRNHRTDSLDNLSIQYANEGRARAEREHNTYLAAIKEELGHERFEVSSYACVASGILNHVYTWDGETPPRGLGKRVCIYCGLDDFDD